jgi:hypothetical protein
MQGATPKNLEGQFKDPERKEKCFEKQSLCFGVRKEGKDSRKRSLPKKWWTLVIHTLKE